MFVYPLIDMLFLTIWHVWTQLSLYGGQCLLNDGWLTATELFISEDVVDKTTVVFSIDWAYLYQENNRWHLLHLALNSLIFRIEFLWVGHTNGSTNGRTCSHTNGSTSGHTTSRPLVKISRLYFFTRGREIFLRGREIFLRGRDVFPVQVSVLVRALVRPLVRPPTAATAW